MKAKPPYIYSRFKEADTGCRGFCILLLTIGHGRKAIVKPITRGSKDNDNDKPKLTDSRVFTHFKDKPNLTSQPFC